MEEAVNFNLWKVCLILFALKTPGLHLPDVHSLMVVMPHPIKLRASSTSSLQCRIMACTCWIGVIRFGGGGRRLTVVVAAAARARLVLADLGGLPGPRFMAVL